MRLCQHGDFEAAIVASAAAAGLQESFVEKDYYVTEVLRMMAERYSPGQVIFKGGTSLSKAWGLIQRLSEDVDLLLVPERFDPPLGRGRVDAELAAMTEAISTRADARCEPNVADAGPRTERLVHVRPALCTRGHCAVDHDRARCAWWALPHGGASDRFRGRSLPALDGAGIDG